MTIGVWVPEESFHWLLTADTLGSDQEHGQHAPAGRDQVQECRGDWARWKDHRHRQLLWQPQPLLWYVILMVYVKDHIVNLCIYFGIFICTCAYEYVLCMPL